MENAVIKKIIIAENIALLTLMPPQKIPHLAYSVVNKLAENKIRLHMLSTSYPGDCVTLAADEKALPQILKITGTEKNVLTVVHSENSKISLLGENLDNTEFLVKNILDPLSEYNADVRLITSSPHEISILMPSCKTAPFLYEITKFAKIL